jgi:lysozyme
MPTPVMTPRVVDLSHHNTVTDLKLTAKAGVWGVIHKASQGSTYKDPTYDARRKMAKDAGLLWGAYHFNDGSTVATQVDWFLKCAAPDDATLLVLDFEDNAPSNMSVQQAVQFLRLLEAKTGRKGAIYSGNRLKENIGKLNEDDRVYVCQHRLWLCQYGPNAVLPTGFTEYYLWQFSADGVGPLPHSVPGIKDVGVDLNVYNGDQDALIASWAPTAAPIVMASATTETPSAHATDAALDIPPPSTPPTPGLPPEKTFWQRVLGV